LFALALIAAVPLALGEGADAAPGDVTVSGRVVTGFDAEGKIMGLSGVTVYVNGEETGEVTDEGGYFSFEVPAGEHLLGFVKGGYGVLNQGALQIDTTAGALSGLEIVMGEAFGTIFGTVTHNGNPLSGIIVYVHDMDGYLVARTASDSAGYSVVCRTGEYTVSVNSPYYDEESYDVRLMGAGDTAEVNFELTVKRGATYLFELDLTHSMMLIGGIIGLILLIFAILYRINIGKHPGTSKIYSERKKKDQE
jgi:hypothetical protein